MWQTVLLLNRDWERFLCHLPSWINVIFLSDGSISQSLKYIHEYILLTLVKDSLIEKLISVWQPMHFSNTCLLLLIFICVQKFYRYQQNNNPVLHPRLPSFIQVYTLAFVFPLSTFANWPKPISNQQERVSSDVPTMQFLFLAWKYFFNCINNSYFQWLLPSEDCYFVISSEMWSINYSNIHLNCQSYY